jgi:hypothetical protein
MRIFVVIMFMLLPFALTVMLPSVVVHAHELAPATDHDGHEGHHHHKGDCPKSDDDDKTPIKFHSHDGQVPEYLAKDYPPLKQNVKSSLPAPLPHSIFPSRNIKPPLEPPSAL